MTQTMPLRCQCGSVRGRLTGVSPSQRGRAVCYCDDCQIAALHLERADALDGHGGSDGYTAFPSQVTIDQGASELRCLRLSPKGTFRWYTACCKTPVAITLKPKIPVAIMLRSIMDPAGVGKTVDDVLGPPAMRMQGRFAAGGAPPGTHPKVPFALLPHVLGHLARGFLRGRSRPSPFFDDRGQPRATPTLIDVAERESLRERVRSAARG